MEVEHDDVLQIGHVYEYSQYDDSCFVECV